MKPTDPAPEKKVKYFNLLNGQPLREQLRKEKPI